MKRGGVVSIACVILGYQITLIGLNVIPIGFYGVLNSFSGQSKNLSLLVSFAMTGAMSLFLLLVAIPFGFFVNKLPHRGVFILAIFLMSISGFIGYFSTHIHQLLFARIIFGLGFLMSDVMFSSLISEYSTNTKSTMRNFALANGFNMAGNISYTFLASFLSQDLWRMPHFFVGCGIFFVPLFIFLMQSSKAPDESGRLVFQKIKDLPFGVIGIFVSTHILAITTLGLLAITTPTLVLELGFGNHIGGRLISAMWVGAAFASFFSAKVFKNAPIRKSYFAGAIFCFLGSFGIFLTTLRHTAVLVVFLEYFVVGAGFGMIFANGFLLLREITMLRQTSIVASVISFIMGIGYITGPVIKNIATKQNGSISPYISIISVLILCFSAILLKLTSPKRR